ncbi:aromatic ring-hydroxylating oxygenase subunit alpha [Colwellia sp. Bg11-28]|uniref:aromatic ring-hydroxylating oxygenase subunit alpha n=1 Tax=Colwellia sp. Bg11-28 TaxID=2058305 RepID=UPI0018E39341|nr:aromatic ring-hydroxylating dioxygenase subunit alpha [Colwellia sp. Bg11-28]
MNSYQPKELPVVPSYNNFELQSVGTFEKELSLLGSQWNFIDHVSSYKNVGDYKVHEFLDESIIIVKTKNGFRSFINFCSHRGSVLCTSAQGNKKSFVCPYHNWTFDLEGNLKHAPAFPTATDSPEKHKLKSIQINEIEGLLFVGLENDHMVRFDDVKDALAPLFAWQGLKESKIAHKRSYRIKANWKMAVDNFFECYHCYANHPEMCELFIHPNITATDVAHKNMKFLDVWQTWTKATQLLGHPTGGIEGIDPEVDQFNVIYRTPLNVDAKSYGKNGAALAPLMGKYKTFDNGETFGYSGALLQFSMPNDHAYMAKLNPISVNETEIELFWFVDKSAEEGIDYNIDELTCFWDTTVQQDIVAIERAAKGSKSKYYKPGNYTKLEKDSARFALWYRRKMAQISDIRII